MKFLLNIAVLFLPLLTWADQIEDLVKGRLKDPSSAQFEQVSKFSNGNACGLVNAKNSLGGYVGRKPFAISNNMVRLDWDSLRSACSYASNPTKYDEEIKNNSKRNADLTYTKCKPHFDKFINEFQKIEHYYKPLSAIESIAYISFEVENGRDFKTETIGLSSCGKKFESEVIAYINKNLEIKYKEYCIAGRAQILNEMAQLAVRDRSLIEKCGEVYAKKAFEDSRVLEEEFLKARAEAFKKTECEKKALYAKTGDDQTRKYWQREYETLCQ